MPGSHAYYRTIRGECLDCVLAETAPKHSTCWACGHVINHAIGHDCECLDD